MKKAILLLSFTLQVIYLFGQDIYVPNGLIGISNNQYVGIGLSDPSEKLEIKNGNLKFNGITSNSFGSLGRVDFFNSYSASQVVAARIEGKRDSYSHKDGRLSFYTADVDGNLRERLILDRLGSLVFNGLTSNSYGSLGRVDFFNSYSASQVVAARIEGKRDSYSHKDGRLSFQTADVDGNLKENMVLDRRGYLGLGTSSPDYMLDVLGTIRAREIKVDLNGADFVFENDYRLRTLEDVESFVIENKHLPEIESAKNMESDGAELGALNSKLLQKIEELTLYMIDMNKRMNSLETENSELKEKMLKMETQP